MWTKSASTILSLAIIFSLVRAQDTVSPQDQRQKKAIRIFVDGEKAPVVIARQRLHDKELGYGLVINVVENTDFDMRVILTTGSEDSSPAGDESMSPNDYCTAVALGRDGSFLFTLTRVGFDGPAAVASVLWGLFKNIRELGLKQNPKLAQPPLQPGEPPDEAGAYYRNSSKWTRLAQATASYSTAGMGMALLSGGMTGLKTMEVYEGAEARTRITEKRPTFFIQGYQVSNPEFLIVRLKKKNDSREVEAGRVSIFSQRIGYKDSETRWPEPIKVSTYTVKLTPVSDLSPGEYLLVVSGMIEAAGRYDFNISQ